MWKYEGGTFSARTMLVYWPQYDLIVTTFANSVVTTEDRLTASLVFPIYAALQGAGLIPGAGTNAVPGGAGIASTAGVTDR